MPISVAEFLSFHIDASPKSQKEIAREVGFPKPNILSMLKSGETRLPLARAPAMALALGVSPSELVRLCLQEYEPEMHAAIEHAFPLAFLSDAEIEIVALLRSKFLLPSP